jgi:hypothetical protein
VNPRSIPELPSTAAYRAAARASSPGPRSDPDLENLWADKLAPLVLVSRYPPADPADPGHTPSRPQVKEAPGQRRRFGDISPDVSSAFSWEQRHRLHRGALFWLLSTDNFVVFKRKLELFAVLGSNTEIIVPPGGLRLHQQAESASSQMARRSWRGSVILPSSLIETLRAVYSANSSLP